MRRNRSSQLKARVALTAVRGEHRLAELAEQFDVRPNEITQRKLQGLENMAGALNQGAAGEIAEAGCKELHVKIGRLTPERYFFEQAFSNTRKLHTKR